MGYLDALRFERPIAPHMDISNVPLRPFEGVTVGAINSLQSKVIIVQFSSLEMLINLNSDMVKIEGETVKKNSINKSFTAKMQFLLGYLRTFVSTLISHVLMRDLNIK